MLRREFMLSALGLGAFGIDRGTKARDRSCAMTSEPFSARLDVVLPGTRLEIGLEPRIRLNATLPPVRLEVAFAYPASARFVDSENGADVNDGRSKGTPFRTLDAVRDSGLASGSIIVLARGSVFHGEIDGWPAGLTFYTYGDLDAPKPSIDGREVADASAFSKTVGRTNVYEVAWSHDFDAAGGKCKHRAWQDGSMLTRVGSVTICDATPGSFFANTPTTGGPDTIWVHPTGSTDPRTDGNEYEFSKRKWCVQLADHQNHARVFNLDTIGNAHADGSLKVDGYSSGCTPRDGRVHNAYLLGAHEDLTALGVDSTEDFNMVVSHVTVSTEGGTRSTVFRRCTANTGRGYVGLGLGFYVHGDVNQGTLQYEDCNVIGPDGGYGGVQADTFLYKSCRYSDVKYGYLAVGLTRTVILGGAGSTANTPDNRLVWIAASGLGFELIVHGCKFYRATSGGQGPIYISAPSCTWSIQRCSLVNANSAGTWNFLLAGSGTWRRNCTHGTNQTPVRLGQSSAQIASFDADFNNYHPTSGNPSFQSEYPSHVDYLTLAAWRSYLVSQVLGAGTEQNSTQLDPQFADPANGDFTRGNATLVTAGIGAEQDDDEDDEIAAYFDQYKVAA